MRRDGHFPARGEGPFFLAGGSPAAPGVRRLATNHPGEPSSDTPAPASPPMDPVAHARAVEEGLRNFYGYVRRVTGLTVGLGLVALALLFVFAPGDATADDPWRRHATVLSLALGLAVGLLNFRFVDVRAVEYTARCPGRAVAWQIRKLIITLVVFGAVMAPALVFKGGVLSPMPLVLGLLAPRTVLSLDAFFRPPALHAAVPDGDADSGNDHPDDTSSAATDTESVE